MNTLLLFFAFPVATIILAIVFQKILQSPILVAATFFAIYLIVAFTAFDASFLVFVIAYTLLAYLTAAITQIIHRFIKRCLTNNDEEDSNDENEQDNEGCIEDNQNCCCGLLGNNRELNNNNRFYRKTKNTLLKKFYSK